MIRIANGQGFWGDSLEAPVEQVRRGPIDYLTLDYLAEVTMYQPYPSGGQSADPERPPAPAPVRTAVKLMYAGAAIWTVLLISALVLIISGNQAGHATLNGHTLTAADRTQLLDPVSVIPQGHYARASRARRRLVAAN